MYIRIFPNEIIHISLCLFLFSEGENVIHLNKIMMQYKSIVGPLRGSISL